MTVRRMVLLGAALLLALLIPSASVPGIYKPPTASDSFTATVVTPEPLEAHKPSVDETRKRVARDIFENNPWHYQCQEYPEVPQPSDLVPTANVTVRISFDHRTGQFETIKIDPRIVISYETRYETKYDIDHEPSRTTPGAIATDHYSWTLAPGVKMYGIFVRAVDTDGSVEWTTINQPLLDKDETHSFTAWRQDLEDRQLDVWVVATDTANCRQDSNPLPNGMWDSVLTDDMYDYMLIA